MPTKRVLLTGGTGFIGSHIAAGLLRDGHHVSFLARSDTKWSAKERILRSMAPLAMMPQNAYQVFDGDITSNLNFDLDSIDEAWHCAASLSFKEEDRIETLATNVGGTKNFLEFAKRLKVRKLHFLSTAYVCGSGGGDFYNPYEESKALAEELARQWSRETGGKLTIYRPSVIVGNAKTGYASKFDGYYTCARGFYLMRRLLEADLTKNSAKYDGSGIRIESGILRLPIYFPGFQETTVNLLPIDVAVKTILLLSGFTGTFYVTNETPILLPQLVNMSMKALGIRDVFVGEPEENRHPVLDQLQRQINNAARYYKPYAYYGRNSPVFDQTETARALGKPLAFKISQKFVKTILDYAKSVNFKG